LLASAYEESVIKPVLLLNWHSMLIKKCLRLALNFLKKIFNDLFLRDLKGQNSHGDSVKVTSDEIAVNDKNTSGQKRGRKAKKVKIV